MIAGRDSSSDRPTLAVARQAYEAGIRVWGGYLATRGGVGLASIWDEASFLAVQEAGLRAIGFCSGWDDPVGVAALGRVWKVLPCLDVEDGIRGDGPWVSEWLAASGAGLYGNFSVHYQAGEPVGRGAAFNIGAAYPCGPPACCDPDRTWPATLQPPPRLRGWQYCGTHAELGLLVDSLWLDDGFKPGNTDPRSGGAMGFLSRDATGETLDESYVHGGEAFYGSWPGGAGDWIAATSGNPGNLGSPQGAKDLIKVDAAYTTHPADGLRLNVRGIRLDGSRWILVLKLADFSIAQPWTQTTTLPVGEDLSEGTADIDLRTYLRGGPK